MTDHEAAADTEARHAHRDLLAEKDAEIERLKAQLEEITDALQNVMGIVDTPISRRRLCINEDQPEWLTSSRDTLARIKEPRNA